MFALGMQNDAHELYTILVNALHDDSNAIPLDRIFWGQETLIMTCQHCKQVCVLSVMLYSALYFHPILCLTHYFQN